MGTKGEREGGRIYIADLTMATKFLRIVCYNGTLLM